MLLMLELERYRLKLTEKDVMLRKALKKMTYGKKRSPENIQILIPIFSQISASCSAKY